MNEGARAVVVGHGDFAAGIVSAVDQITGRGFLFIPLSNRGLGPEELERRLGEELDRGGIRVIFTDLAGGSWTIAARRLLRARGGETVLVTGTNLAALLDFAFRDEDPGAAARQAADRGRAALGVLGGGGEAGGGGGERRGD